MSLDDKVREVFGPLAVRKELARGELFQKIPRYVTEFLIAKYVDPEDPAPGLERIKRLVEEHYPGHGQAQVIRHRLMQQGSFVLLDEIEVRVDLESGIYWARIPSLDEDRARIRPELPDRYPALLAGGMWGTARLRYTPDFELKGRVYPIEIIAFEPFQARVTRLEPYLQSREAFTTEEWIDLLLRSVGYEPTALPNRRVKLLLLTRLLPLVEPNLNLIELGPRQTGKTFLLRNTSPHAFIISGGKATPANLFVNLATGQLGIIGTRKVVFFDEIAHTQFGDAATTLSIFKDYMESGQFSRGNKTFVSDASIVFAGNLDVQGNRPDPGYPHLFAVLPPEMQDTALLDRLHGFIPGWELPKISPGLLAKGYGLVTDYLADVFNQLRSRTFQDLIRRLPLADTFTQRDERAVARLVSGYAKLFYPHGQITDEELYEIAALAAELRQRVHNQLTVMAPGEFKAKRLSFHGMPDFEPVDFRQYRDFQLRDDRANRENLVGEVTGLVALVYRDQVVGGDIMLVEVSAFSGSPGVKVTGVSGQTLRHSVEATYAYVRDNARKLGVPDEFLKSKQVHVHLVRIATPREGPSAGLTFLVGIVSALTGWPVRAGVALTGEVSLHGRVTAVGAVPQKILAAYRHGRKLVIIPKENEADLAQVPPEVLSEITVVPVENAAQALEVALVKPQSA